MNERIKELRKYLKMNQEDFGKLLGITKSGVSDIESGRRNVTEQHIFMLKSQKNVNESWLRDGTGEMFVELDVEDQRITAFMEAVLEEGKGSFRRRVILGLSAMDGDGWKALEQFLGSVCHEPQ